MAKAAGGPGITRILLSAVLLAAVPVSAAEPPLEERLELLEAEIQSLRQQLSEERQADDATPPEVESVEPGRPDAVTGEVRARYYLDAQPLQAHPPDGEPLAAGLVSLDGPLVMDPVRYGAAPGGLLGRYTDPSVHRAAGLLLEGRVDIPESGHYRLQFSPKPAREGGSPVTNTMIVRLEVDGEEIVAMDDVRSWRAQTFERELDAGRHPFRLWVVSNSPGYGPSPTATRLDIHLQMPGRAELTPLHRFTLPPAP